MKKLLSAMIILAALAVMPALTHADGTGTIKGKVNCEGKPLEGAYVLLYSGSEGGFRGEPAVTAGPTKADGLFEAQAAPGSYYLIAQKRTGGRDGGLAAGDYYSYYGGNPVDVGAGDTINVGINCTAIIDSGKPRVPGGTGIRGKVYADGAPLDRARVTLYQDGDTIFRGIGYASTLTNKNGDFSFSLEPGTYYAVARKRAGDDRMGPLTAGDMFAYTHENPVEVVEDSYSVISMNAATKLLKVKESGQEVTLGGTVKAGGTVISGTVVDKDGRPVAGVFASAYRDSMMTQKPDFMSQETGPDGRYVINISEGGEYFVGARNTIGGPAEKGELLGRYAGNEDHSVNIATGQKVDGIDITVEPVE